MVLGIENWPNNVTGLFFASRLHWLHASWVCLHSNHSLKILNFMSELLNEQQKIDLSDFFPGWQHVQQKRGKGLTLKSCVAPPGITVADGPGLMRDRGMEREDKHCLGSLDCIVPLCQSLTLRHLTTKTDATLKIVLL